MKHQSIRTRGFTLIELLTVVTILALVAGMAAMQLSSDPKRVLENAGKRFVQQFNLVSEDAALSGLDYGLRIDDNDYYFLLWDQLQWNKPTDADLMKIQRFPEQLEITLIMEDDAVLTLESENDENDLNLDAEEDETPLETPQILLLSSGEVTPFNLEIRVLDNDKLILLEVDSLGRIEVQRENDN